VLVRDVIDNIPYEFKVGDQMLFETPGILRKLSTSLTASPCNECIQEWYNQNPKRQKGIVAERVNIRRITPIYQMPN
jgi:hypothetical protein